MPAFIAALGLAGLFWLLKSAGDVTVQALSPLLKRVDVDGRGYLVARLGSGNYSVTKVDNPAITLTLSQNGITNRIGDTSQLETDMNRFPTDLFTA